MDAHAAVSPVCPALRRCILANDHDSQAARRARQPRNLWVGRLKTYAIVGLGHRAQMYLEALLGAHAGEGRLVGLCDSNSGRAEAAASGRAGQGGAKSRSIAAAMTSTGWWPRPPPSGSS